MLRTQAGNLPTMMESLYARSSAADAVILLTRRPFRKKNCMERFGRLAVGFETKPSTETPFSS